MGSYLKDKRVLVTGGTGSLGTVLTKRLLQEGASKIRIFSRDEAKQYAMLRELKEPKLEFQLGDIRNSDDVRAALQEIDIVFNTAALKQVPNCEYAPWQAVQTNVMGAENIVKNIAAHSLPVKVVVGILTDKCVKPVNVMGMTKALQERVFIHGNLRCKETRFVCARYGNVLASRGSLIPLLHSQIAKGGPMTITSPSMTRFLMNLDEAVNLIFNVVEDALPGEIFIPRIRSARVMEIAEIFSERTGIPIEIIGERP